MKRYVLEAVAGIAIGALVLWTIIVSGGNIDFVYQGF